MKIFLIWRRCLIVAGIAFLSAPSAFADGSINLLHEIETKKCSATSKPSSDFYSRDFGTETLRTVSRDKILSTLVEKNALKIDVAKYGDLPYRDALIAMLVPCAADNLKKSADAKILSGTDAEQNRKNRLEGQITACEAFAKLPQVSPELRFKGKPGALAIRRSLLRLFEATQRGGTKKFSVRLDRTTYPPGQTYRPLVSQLDDDKTLLHYLNAKVGQEPFALVCNPENEDDPAPTVTDFNVVWTPARFLAKEREVSDGPSKLHDKCYSRGSVTPECKGKWKLTQKIVLVKDAGQFVKQDEGATFGTAIPRDLTDADDPEITNPSDTQLKASAAIGWRLQLTWTDTHKFKPAGANVPPVEITSTDKFGIIPYVSIEQTNPVQKYLALDKDQAVIIAKKTIAYAEMAAGLRLEYQGEYFRKDQDAGDYSRPNRYTAPGLSWSLSGELITDNYNLQSASRIAFEISPPAGMIGNPPGYRRDFPIDVLNRKSEARTDGVNWWESAFSGLYLNWDAQIALEYLDFSRRPRDFGEPPELNPETGVFGIAYKDSFPEYGLIGTNLQVQLTKRGHLGLFDDPKEASLSIRHIYRDSLSSSESSERWQAKFKITDPMESKRSVALVYTDGEDYTSTQEEETLGIEISAKY